MQEPMKPINSADGLFHDGNPYSGELGTVVTSDWLNGAQSAIQATQQELLTVIKSNGQKTDPSRQDQLLQAMQNLAWGGAQRPTTLAGYGIADAMKASDWGVQGYTTLQVGPGKAFASIQDAWDSLIGKVLQADVLIQIADGQYATSGITLTHQPFASRIRIQGNVANPSACKIILVPDANKLSHGVIFSRVQGVNFSGFHIVGEAGANHWSHRCLRVEEASVVYADAGSIVLEGAGNGLELDQNARGNFERLRVLNCKNCAVLVGGGAHAWLPSSTLIGLGRYAETVVPAFVNVDTPKFRPMGLECQEGSKAWASDSSISNVDIGYMTTRNSYLWCDGTAVDQSNIGMYAQYGGVCWSCGAQARPSLPQGRRSKVTNSGKGYYAEFGGIINADMAVAENCEHGFFATWNSVMTVSNGWARNCTKGGYHAEMASTIAAYNTDTTGTATAYDPNQNFSNWNGIVVTKI